MRPLLPVHNHRDSALGHRESFRYCALLFTTAATAPDFDNVGFCEFRHAMLRPCLSRLAKNIHRVALVLALRDPFKVLDAVVALDAIFVIALTAYRPWADEGFEHQVVDETPLGLHDEAHTMVSARGVWLKDGPVSHVTDATDAADFVVRKRCDLAPFFHGRPYFNRVLGMRK